MSAYVRSLAFWLGLLSLACGGRAELTEPPPRQALLRDEQPVGCLSDTDCTRGNLCAPDRCLNFECEIVPVFCDDGDPCSKDSCDLSTGACSSAPLTPDEDGDGFRRPLAGMLPGEPGACGQDCNDTSAQAYPGGVELCDGVDNDCDGVVDNGALFSPSTQPPRLVSGEARLGIPGGIVHAEAVDAYGVVFTHRNSGSENRFALLAPELLAPDFESVTTAGRAISEINSDTFAGPIVWTGNVFATAWEDRRDSDYEIYFNRLNAEGEKLGPDLRVTAALGFSLRPSLVFDGQYTLAWEDHRGRGNSRIYAKQLTATGEPVGDDQPITPAEIRAAAPVLALGGRRLGMVFGAFTGNGNYGLGFRSFAVGLTDPSEVVLIPAQNATGGSIVYNGQGRFVVSWHTENGVSAGPAIFGTVLNEQGEVLVSARALTAPAAFARYHSMVPFGDRLLLIWSEWREDRYNLYARELADDLSPLGDAVTLTEMPGGAYGPTAALGREEVGILFSGKGSGDAQQQAYFTRLSCNEASPL